jgi:hypothetical protein
MVFTDPHHLTDSRATPMIETLFCIAIGILIGWNLPQPAWARDLQAKAVDYVRNLTRRSG